MEDKRDTKHARFSSKEGSPSPDSAKTPSSAPSGSPLPLTSPSEVSSCCPRSLVWKQGGSSRKTLVVDLSSSSDEKDLITNVSQDEDLPLRLFGDLNRDILGSPGDGKIIILSDSNEEEKMYEKKVIDVEAVPSSAVRFSASTTSVDADDAPTGM
jgi:hypothetical protein